MLMTKGLMDRALHQEMALERVREKARLTDEELLELKSWKVVTEQKLKLAEQTSDWSSDVCSSILKTQSMLWGKSLLLSGARTMRT